MEFHIKIVKVFKPFHTNTLELEKLAGAKCTPYTFSNIEPDIHVTSLSKNGLVYTIK